MKITGALASVGSVVCLALTVGCASAAGDGSELGEGDAADAAAAPGEDFDYAPAPEAAADSKQAVEKSLSGKGSTSVPYGKTFMVPLTIPAHGTVACYTTGGTNSVDPVLALFRRHDNQFGFTYTEESWLQTLALNDDDGYNGTNSYFHFDNPSGAVLNAYLTAFAYANRTGDIGLWCTGGPTQTVTLAAGSARVWVGSGTASTSSSVASGGGGGDPWLFGLDETPLSYWSFANDDKVGVESGFSYSGGNRYVWFMAHNYNGGTGTSTINW
jgi:hypothetical protein